MIDPERGVRGSYQFDLRVGQQRWGMAAHLKRNRATGCLEGFVHLSPQPQVGDALLLTFATGPRALIFRTVKWTMNVDDMYAVTLSEPTKEEGGS